VARAGAADAKGIIDRLIVGFGVEILADPRPRFDRARSKLEPTPRRPQAKRGA
jgi:hypothetical protein